MRAHRLCTVLARETATCSNGVTVARLLVLCARVEVGARNSNAELELVPDTVHFVRVLGDILTCAAEPQLRCTLRNALK
jgi:hypothetical protein